MNVFMVRHKFGIKASTFPFHKKTIVSRTPFYQIKLITICSGIKRKYSSHFLQFHFLLSE